MQIFLTGATGYIGGAVLDALVRHGHGVTALVRDRRKAARVAARGAKAIVGDMADPATYQSAIEGHDGGIHAAFDMAAGRGAETERIVVETMSTSLSRSAGASRSFFIYTSGVWVIGAAPRPVAEDAPTNPVPHVAWRAEIERLVLGASSDHLRTVVVRPGIVYGGNHGIVGDLFKSAANGLVRIVGDGANHWPLVYDRDLAELYALLAARDDAEGIYHATDDGDERVNEIVAAIGSHLAVRPDVRKVPIEEARAKMGTFADALALDQIVRSPRARALGWTPTLHSVGGNAARLLGEWRTAQTVET